MADDDTQLGPLYVALGNASAECKPSYILVKRDSTSSYLPAWYLEADVQRYIDRKLPGEAKPVLLTRAALESAKKACAELGHELFVKVGDV